MTAAALLRAMAFVGRSGGMSEGERLAERSLGISRELGDREGMSQALQVLGVWAWIRGPYARAGELLGEAIETARLARSPLAEANASHVLGLVAAAMRDLTRARAVLEATAELLDRAPEDAARPFSWRRWAACPRSCRASRSGAWCRRTRRSHSARPDRAPRRGTCSTASPSSRAWRGTRRARTCCWESAFARLSAVGDEAGVAQTLAAIGRLATLQGDGERAAWALGESLTLRRRLGDIRSVGLTLGLLAELAADGGDLGHARALLGDAIATFGNVRDRPGVLWLLGRSPTSSAATARPAPLAITSTRRSASARSWGRGPCAGGRARRWPRSTWRAAGTSAAGACWRRRATTSPTAAMAGASSAARRSLSSTPAPKATFENWFQEWRGVRWTRLRNQFLSPR